MALHALSDLDDAYDVTRRFLTPVDPTTWVKLAIVTFFLGVGGANVNPIQYTFGNGDGGGTGTPSGDVVFPEIGMTIWAVIGLVIVVLLAIALLFGLVSAIMEFVFIESLQSGEVTIRRSWSRRWKQGIRLFGFRIAIGLFVLLGILLLATPFILAILGRELPSAGVWIGVFLLLVPVLIVLGLVIGLVNGFTTVFVVPIMIHEDGHVLPAWRRLWPSVTANGTEYLAYAVAGFILQILGGIVTAIGTLLLAIILLIPFGLLIALGVAVLVYISEPVGIALLVLVGLVLVLSLVALATLVSMPVVTYLRYYALLVLGDIEPEFDLIPDQRASVREGSGASRA